jgi:hypothetical protein
MKIARRIGLVLVGALVGVLMAGPVRAVQERRNQMSGRLFFIDAGINSNTSSLVFIRDNKSGGCWLGVDVRGRAWFHWLPHLRTRAAERGRLPLPRRSGGGAQRAC